MSFRDIITRLAPTFLQRQWGQKYLYALGLTIDGVFDWVNQGINARYPSFAPPDALAYIGRDRIIRRGFVESDEGYALRLRSWLDDWRIAGSPFSILEQVRRYLTGYAVRLRTVSPKGTWLTIEPDGSYAIDKLKANWEWDGHPEKWSRFWVIIYPLSTGLWTDEGTWGDGTSNWGDAGQTWGLSATQSQVSSIREIIRTFKPAGVRELWTIVAFDDSSFDPASLPGSPNMPDGTWGTWSVSDMSGVHSRSRLATARYADGTSHITIEIG